MRLLVALLAIGALAGCTTVRVRREGNCWVQSKSRFLGSSSEVVGPCTRAEPDWSSDRYTRLVQECIAQEDHRWMTRALSHWQRGEPLPARESEEAIARQCFESAVAIAARENDELRSRLDEMRSAIAEEKERQQSLAAQIERTFDQIRAANSRLADHLGAAARKASAPATATATASADGRATTHHRSALDAASATTDRSGGDPATRRNDRSLAIPRPARAPGAPVACEPTGPAEEAALGGRVPDRDPNGLRADAPPHLPAVDGPAGTSAPADSGRTPSVNASDELPEAGGPDEVPAALAR